MVLHLQGLEREKTDTYVVNWGKELFVLTEAVQEKPNSN